MHALTRTLLTIVVAVAMSAHAETAPTLKQAPTTASQLPKLTPQQLALPPPIRIVRAPIAYTPKALTNKVIPKSSLTRLIDRGLTLRLPRSFPPPAKRALVVILENGGIMNNVDPALRSALNVNLATITCGSFEFELRPGETIMSTIARYYGQLAESAIECINPGNWRQETFNPLVWLNQQTDYALENAVKAHNSLVNTQNYYDQVVVMEDADAVPARVIATMKSLAQTHVMDVHVLTHGSHETFSGQSTFTDANFFQPLKVETDADRMYIRAVYQMNCFSSTLKDNWTGVGAITVNGTQNPTLNNMPHQYFHFLERWLAQQPQGMSTASQGSFNDAEKYTRPVYSLVGKGNLVDPSRLTATGSNDNANVNTGM